MASEIAFHNRYDNKLDAFFSRPKNNVLNSRINLQTADIGKLAKALARAENENLFSAKSFKIGFVSQLAGETLHKTIQANNHYVGCTVAHECGALAATANSAVTQYSTADISDRSVTTDLANCSSNCYSSNDSSSPMDITDLVRTW